MGITDRTKAQANTAPIIFTHDIRDSTRKDNNNNSNENPFDTNSVVLGVEMTAPAHYSQVEPPHVEINVFYYQMVYLQKGSHVTICFK